MRRKLVLVACLLGLCAFAPGCGEFYGELDDDYYAGSPYYTPYNAPYYTPYYGSYGYYSRPYGYYGPSFGYYQARPYGGYYRGGERFEHEEHERRQEAREHFGRGGGFFGGGRSSPYGAPGNPRGGGVYRGGGMGAYRGGGHR